MGNERGTSGENLRENKRNKQAYSDFANGYRRGVMCLWVLWRCGSY